MRRIGGVAIAALVFALALFAVPARAASCVSGGGGPAPGQPGVVLGPATKCVRSGDATLPGVGSDGTAKTGNVKEASSASPWLYAGIPAIFALGFGVRVFARSRKLKSVGAKAA